MGFFRKAVVSLLDRWWPARQGSGQCACGAVKMRLTVPGSSYALVDQTTALCHCHDCVGFVQALASAAASASASETSAGDSAPSPSPTTPPKCREWMVNGATQMVNFYQSDVTILQGLEHVGVLKLTGKTPCIRCYCRRCHTPLGLQADLEPLTIVGIYAHVLTDYPLVFLPRLVLNVDSATPGVRRYGGVGIVVRRGMLAPLFIVRAMGRVLLGLLLNKGGPGLLGGAASRGAIPVGVESIGAATTNKRD